MRKTDLNQIITGGKLQNATVESRGSCETVHYEAFGDSGESR